MAGVVRVGLLAILASVVPRAAASQNDVLLPEGPWGRVELVPIAIRLPETMVPEIPLPIHPWITNAGREETARMLADTGMNAALAERLLSTHESNALRPTVGMIRALEPGVRSRLYEALRQLPENQAQRAPHRFHRRRLGHRFRRLSPTTFGLLAAFFYERPHRPDSLFLADLPSVMRLIDDRRERARLIQAVSEQESVLLRLQLDTDSDVEALAEYWGRGGRRRDLEILLDSLVDGTSSRRIDVLYLLPPFARGFLLTYPRLDNAPDRDCFWTALNFFLPAPDDRLVGQRLARSMAEKYELVQDELQLGDMLILWRSTGEAEHAAIFIAGDIYFTKNGNNVAMPWLFMPLSEILERYDEAERTPLTHYRLKDLD